MSFRILLVDDSRLVRTAVSDIIKQIAGAEIYGEAKNGQECLEILSQAEKSQNWPELIILDIEMPVLDGISTLKEMKRRGYSVRVLMLSVLTVYGALSTFRAMDLGAMDFLPKPSPDSGLSLQDIEKLIKMHISRLMTEPAQTKNKKKTKDTKKLKSIKRLGSKQPSPKILAIGASTGGPPALQLILEKLNNRFPLPILIVQHMPPVFTKAFAERLDGILGFQVAEAKEAQNLLAGHVYIAPGNHHLELQKNQNEITIHLTQSPPRFSHRPSVDVTMEQIADLFGAASIGLILTGMGRDGVEGMKKIQESGGITIAQDETSSVIYGMNRRAIEADAVQEVLPLKEIPKRLQQLAESVH